MCMRASICVWSPLEECQRRWHGRAEACRSEVQLAGERRGVLRDMPSAKIATQERDIGWGKKVGCGLPHLEDFVVLVVSHLLISCSEGGEGGRGKR